jgi:peptidoglycan/xylan/chitin deacetylase (PgdA/CDA1 family)
MDGREWFTNATAGFRRVLAGMSEEQLDDPGLGAWDVRSLLGHTCRAFTTIEAYLIAAHEAPSTLTLQGPGDYFKAAAGGLAYPAQVSQRGRHAGAALGEHPTDAGTQIVERVNELVRRTADDAGRRCLLPKWAGFLRQPSSKCRRRAESVRADGKSHQVLGRSRGNGCRAKHTLSKTLVNEIDECTDERPLQVYHGGASGSRTSMSLEHGPRTACAVGRRKALGVLGAAMVTVLSACASTDNPQSPRTGLGHAAPGSTPPSPSPADPSPTPTLTKRVPTGFTPDYQLPPIQNGLAPVITRIQTKLPVVFLTIDDGITKTPEMAALMTEFDLPVSLFLTRNFVQDNPGFFKSFKTQGSLVENHTVSHNTNMVRQMSYTQQLGEITAMQDYAQQQFGRRPTLFRPPGGAYSNVMRKAVADAGLKAIITWEAKANAGHMDYQVGSALRPGDIVLMHFRPEFAADLAAFRQAQTAAGLEVVLLEDFLGVI